MLAIFKVKEQRIILEIDKYTFNNSREYSDEQPLSRQGI